MAQSRVGAPTDGGIGEQAADFNAWDKLQLGWLDYEIVAAGQNRTVELGPHEYNTKRAQSLVVTLPKKPLVHDLGATGGRHQVMVERRGQQLHPHDEPSGHAAGRPARQPHLPGQLGHRGLRRDGL